MTGANQWRLCSDLAEIARESESLAAFRRGALTQIQQVVEFEVGFIQSSASGSICATGFAEDDRALGTRFIEALLEYDLSEIRRMTVGLVTSADEVFSAARRENLSTFKDIFRPLGMTHVIACVAMGRSGTTGFTLGRRTPFSERARRVLNAASPVLMTAEALLTRHERATVPAWADSVALTPRETEIAQLVLRGLTNLDVARITGCSHVTVRNHLATIFRKARVTSRAELAFNALTHSSERLIAPHFHRWEEKVRLAQSSGPTTASSLHPRAHALR